MECATKTCYKMECKPRRCPEPRSSRADEHMKRKNLRLQNVRVRSSLSKEIRRRFVLSKAMTYVKRHFIKRSLVLLGLFLWSGATIVAISIYASWWDLRYGTHEPCPLPNVIVPAHYKPSIAIVTVYDDRHVNDKVAFSEFAEPSIENKRQYADRHGYDLIVARGDRVDVQRGGAWSKILVLQEELPKYDWVLFVDLDSAIMNLDIRLEERILQADEGEYDRIIGDGHPEAMPQRSISIQPQQQQKRDQQQSDSSKKKKQMHQSQGGKDDFQTHRQEQPYDLILTEDWNGVNSGVFMIRNSEFSRWFLDEIWSQSQLVVCPKCPFYYEQRALHYILATEKWKSSPAGRRMEPWRPTGTPRTPLFIDKTRSGKPSSASKEAPEMSSEKVWSHVKVLPMCALQGYRLNLRKITESLILGKGRSCRSYEHSPGDFVLHAAGLKGEVKDKVMLSALKEASEPSLSRPPRRLLRGQDQ